MNRSLKNILWENNNFIKTPFVKRGRRLQHSSIKLLIIPNNKCGEVWFQCFYFLSDFFKESTTRTRLKTQAQPNQFTHFIPVLYLISYKNKWLVYTANQIAGFYIEYNTELMGYVKFCMCTICQSWDR